MKLGPSAWPLGSVCCLLASFLLSSSPAQADVQAIVDPNLVLVDSFEGWGTSLCWWANVAGGYDNRDTYAALAFNVLQLNIVRYNIGGGESPWIMPNTMDYRAQMQGFEDFPGSWNWNADANQRWMLRRAVALGATRVEAFANSPPWWMTVSGSVTGSTNGTSDNLQTAYEDTFAVYLATVVSNLSVLDGVTFDTVTPLNEPTASWWKYGGRQEGCHISAAQQARLVNDLRTELNAQHQSAGIAASEDNTEQSTINSLNAYDSTALGNLARIVSHTYTANNPTGLRNLANAQHKPLWVSEYGDSDASGMTMARRIHDDITKASARAWVYWQVVDNAGGWGMLLNGLNSSGNSDYTINRKFYVMWQFSHFIRPGFRIFNVGDTNTLAAYDSTNHNLILVTVNESTNTFTLNYDLSAFSTLPAQVTRFRTSPAENTNQLSALFITNKQFAAQALAQSVTTHILSNVITTNHAPTLQPIPNVSILAGRTLLVTNTASDPDLPAQTLNWTLSSAPAGATINPTNGLIAWRPAIAQSTVTNILTIIVTDSGTPSLSATQSFSVFVVRPSQPLVSTPLFTNGSLSIGVSGDSGPDYVIEVATNLAPSPLWLPWATNLAAAPPFTWSDGSAQSFPRRFYRIRLEP